MVGGLHPIYEMENSKHVWNHQPDIFLENVHLETSSFREMALGTPKTHQVTDQLEVDHVQPAARRALSPFNDHMRCKRVNKLMIPSGNLLRSYGKWP